MDNLEFDITVTGLPGRDGDTGPAGYTPVRGTDYWTEADIAAIENHCDTFIDGRIGLILDNTYPAE